jgi:DNA-binding transcriptional ArsR family regulator
MKSEKRGGDEIKAEILEFLLKGPSSIKKISDKIESNWSTTSNYLSELKENGKVSELISSGNLKIFRRNDDPVFYGIPIKEEIRARTLYLLLKIIERWKEIKKINIPKTTLQKIAVDVIYEKKLDLPTLDFHYGKVTALAIDPAYNLEKIYPTKSFDEDVILEIDNQIKKHSIFARRERINQYKKYKMTLYLMREKLLEEFENKKDIKNIERFLLELSLEYPSNNNEVFLLLDKFTSSSVLLLNSKDSENFLEDIKDCFYCLWDLLTTNSYFNGIASSVNKENLDLFNEIKSFHIKSKLAKSFELVSDLESVSNSVDISKLILDDEESKKAIGILLEGVEEE